MRSNRERLPGDAPLLPDLMNKWWQKRAVKVCLNSFTEDCSNVDKQDWFICCRKDILTSVIAAWWRCVSRTWDGCSMICWGSLPWYILHYLSFTLSTYCWKHNIGNVNLWSNLYLQIYDIPMTVVYLGNLFYIKLYICIVPIQPMNLSKPVRLHVSTVYRQLYQ